MAITELREGRMTANPEPRVYQGTQGLPEFGGGDRGVTERRRSETLPP